jgi:hypothetical protein
MTLASHEGASGAFAAQLPVKATAPSRMTIREEVRNECNIGLAQAPGAAVNPGTIP